MRLVSYDACLYDNSIWFVDTQQSALLRANGTTGNCRMICELPRKHSLFFPYSSIVACNGKIVCIPGNSGYISIYDVDKETLSCLPLKKIENDNQVFTFPGGHSSFETAAAYQNYVYMFGGASGCILKLNVENNEIEVLQDACRSLLEQRSPQNKYNYFFQRDMAIIKDTVWLTSLLTDAVLEYHMADDTYCIHNLGYSNEGYAGLCYGGSEGTLCLIAANHGELILWNKDQNAIRQCPFLDRVNVELQPGRLLYGFGNVYVFMQNCPKVYMYSIQKGTIRSKTFTDSIDTELLYPRYLYAHIFNGKIYVSATDTSAVYVLSETLAQYNRIIWNIEIEDLQNKPLLMKADMHEKAVLSTLINENELHIDIKKNYGQDIYNYIKQYE